MGAYCLSNLLIWRQMQRRIRSSTSLSLVIYTVQGVALSINPAGNVAQVLLMGEILTDTTLSPRYLPTVQHFNKICIYHLC